jgi:hypothetical protein
MKAKAFQQGDVLKYPYRWRHQEAKPLDHHKDRPVCIALQIEREPGVNFIALLPISDQPNTDKNMTLKIPASELRLAGLSEFRDGYIHLSEVNLDRLQNSFSFNPKTKILGRFSKGFIQVVAKRLAENIRAKRIIMMTRT